MKCQILLYGKTKKKIINLSSAESVHSMVSVKAEYLMIILGYFSYISIKTYDVGTH